MSQQFMSATEIGMNEPENRKRKRGLSMKMIEGIEEYRRVNLSIILRQLETMVQKVKKVTFGRMTQLTTSGKKKNNQMMT